MLPIFNFRVFIFTFLFFTISCQSNGQSSILQKLKPLSYKEPSQELKNRLFVPKVKDGLYFISDYDGNIVSNKSWDEIQINPNLGYYYWGRTGDIWNLYTFPNTKLIEYDFNQVQFDKSTIEKEVKNKYGILTRLETYDKENKSKIKFLFNLNNTQPILKHYKIVDPYNPPEGITKFSNNKYLEGQKYHKILNEDYTYTLIHMSGEEVDFPKFSDYKRLVEDFIVVVNSQNKCALANIKTKIIHDFEFEEIYLITDDVDGSRSYCTSQFKAIKKDENGKRHHYLLSVDGSSVEVSEYDKAVCNNSDLSIVRKIPSYCITYREDDLYGIKLGQEIVVEAQYKSKPVVVNDCQWIILQDEIGQKGLKEINGQWIIPMSTSKISYVEDYLSYHKHAIRYEKDNYTVFFNEKLEVINEPKISNKKFLNLDFSEIDSKTLDNDINSFKLPSLYFGHTLLEDKEHIHLFETSGKYIKSLKGKGSQGFIDYPKPEEHKFAYVPICQIEIDNMKVFVRLTDGYIYKE